MPTKLSKLKEECAKLKQSNRDLREQVKRLKLLLEGKMSECVDKTNKSL